MEVFDDSWFCRAAKVRKDPHDALLVFMNWRCVAIQDTGSPRTLTFHLYIHRSGKGRRRNGKKQRCSSKIASWPSLSYHPHMFYHMAQTLDAMDARIQVRRHAASNCGCKRKCILPRDEKTIAKTNEGRSSAFSQLPLRVQG